MAKRAPYRFPGMDPWLEHPAIWPSVHHDLITSIAWDLSPRLAPRYSAKYGIRVVVEDVDLRSIGPDIAVLRKAREPLRPLAGGEIDPAVLVEVEPAELEQPYIEIRLGGPNGRLVTVIEVLSPSNQTPGKDAAAKYLQEQEEILSSDVHLVEVDLLRAGSHTVSISRQRLRSHEPCDYLVEVRRAKMRHRGEVYPVRLEDRLPRIPIPLAGRDPDAGVDLQAMVESVFERGAYWTLIDYRKPPVPPLSRAQAAWASRVSRRRRS